MERPLEPCCFILRGVLSKLSGPERTRIQQSIFLSEICSVKPGRNYALSFLPVFRRERLLATAEKILIPPYSI